MKRAIMAVTLVCAITFAEPARARYQAELESTYLGDGWFQYRLRTINDPFFWFFDVVGLGIYHFAAHVEFGPDVLQWQTRTFAGSASNPPAIVWDYLGRMTSQIRPYEAVFLARSEYRHFRAGTNANIAMSLGIYEGCPPPFCVMNAVGYANLLALVPCVPEEADGSPTNLLARLDTGVPDVMLDSLLREGDQIRGITFRYYGESTVQLQATRDLKSWVPVAYFHGNPGVTTWTSVTPLAEFGDFFRLLLVAERHVEITNSFASGVSAKSTPVAPNIVNSDVRVLRSQARGSDVEVQVETTPGARYIAKLRSVTGKTLRRLEFDSAGAMTTIVFDGPAPNPIFVTVERMFE